MFSSTLQEDSILEELNQQLDIRSLLAVAIDLINTSIHELILTVFRKENHAINFVIPSLIGKDGPLNDTSVRLRLLYALGLLSREEYEDIELLSAILVELRSHETEYNFTDDEILGPIRLLHGMELPPAPVLQQDSILEHGIIDGLKTSMYQTRYQQTIRSALILAITDLTLRIVNKQKQTYFP